MGTDSRSRLAMPILLSTCRIEDENDDDDENDSFCSPCTPRQARRFTLVSR